METAPPSVDLVYQGIITLFHNTDPKEKEKANKWLGDFQKSIYSWTIADDLLQQKRDLHSCYFAAQTMRNKIQNSFNELPPNSHESLRDSLVSHIAQISNDTEAIIVTQLCLAVADLALLMASWENPVNDLLEMFSDKPLSVWPLLEILTLIPEEIDSRYLRLGANRRKEVHKQLEDATPKTIAFLCLCIEHVNRNSANGTLSAVEKLQNERINNSALRCFSSWMSLHVIPLHKYPDNPLMQHVFKLLMSAETPSKLHDTATECVCAALCCVEAEGSFYKADQFLSQHMFQSICQLESAYHTTVALEDIDKTMNICRIFTVMCETYFEAMLWDEHNPHYSLKGLDLVLICVGHFDYEVAEITFAFWSRLSEELFQRNNDKLTGQFTPYIERLLSGLYRHAQMEADHEGLIEENDNFNDFRRKVSDLIKDVAFIVGSGAVFKQMYMILQTPGTSWESNESALFIMQNVAKNIIPDENDVIPKVVQAILNLPENTHIAVRYTSIMLLGELCDWIENHPDILEAVLNFLLFSLQQKNGLASAAAMALTSICAACRNKMTRHISGLIGIARSLDSYEINNDLAIGLLKGMSLILTKLQRDQLEPAMREIISVQLQPLAQMVEGNGVSVSSIRKGERTDPAYWIDRACAVIRHTSPDVDEGQLHPTRAILIEIWPLLSRVIDRYQMDLRLMERTCRLIRYAIRMVQIQASPIVEPLVKQMICIYVVHHHSCFLYLGSVLVDEFSKSEECISALLEMLQSFIEPTFSMLQVENGLKNNPDTVDDFFRLCSRFIYCCPMPFLKSSLVTPIFQCALLACTLDHREANSSVMKFFCNLLKWGRANSRLVELRPYVKEIAEQNGEQLVLNLLHASVFCLHSYMLPDVADVMHDLKSVVAGGDQMKVYLKRALDSLPKKNSGGYVTATEEQLNEFAQTVLHAETSKSITAALKTFVRLYR